MASHVCVTVTGPALSFLIYENVNSYGDQEGFLLGEVINHVTDTISDTQIRGEKSETLISINSLMSIPSSTRLYNGVGKMDREALKNFLKEKEKEVVGWFSFRRNSALLPYLRDRVLHKELSAALPHISLDLFTMCLLNTSVSDGGSTHVFNHKFMRYRHRKFESLPMQIHNLGEIQPDYKVVPSSACLSDSFKSIIASLTVGRENVSDVDLVRHIQESLQHHLRMLIDDVASSEEKVAELEEEINILRNQRQPIFTEDDLEDAKSSSASIQIPGKSSVTKTSSSVLVTDSDAGGPDIVVEDAYVTKMKIEMGQPTKDTSSRSNVQHEATEPSSQAGGRSSGIPGKLRQQPPSAFNSNTPISRENNPVEMFPSLHNKQPGIRNIPVDKTQGNYAQALKRRGNLRTSGDLETKPIPEGECPGSQDY